MYSYGVYDEDDRPSAVGSNSQKEVLMKDKVKMTEVLSIDIFWSLIVWGLCDWTKLHLFRNHRFFLCFVSLPKTNKLSNTENLIFSQTPIK